VNFFKSGDSLTPCPVPTRRGHDRRRAVEAFIRHQNMVMAGIGVVVFGIWLALH
jgi:hypothetical protein